ncbi:MAG: DnaJ domain-containing protein [Nitrospirae bacterium]|nr:DnaJ domain-containing protein [Nitrospirota bacterium]
MDETVKRDIPLTGRLGETPLPAVLRALQHGQATGILTVTRNDQTKCIYVKNGDMVFASSQYEDDRLGSMLLKENRISYVQYETSIRLMKESKKRQGAILVEQGFLTPKELFQAVTTQVKGIILSLFTWLDGEYRFEEQKLPADEVIALRMSSGALIYEGIRNINDFARLSKLLPPFETALGMSVEPRDLFQAIAVTPPERELLLMINGARTIRDLICSSPLPTLHAMQLLYFLLAIGIIRAKTTDEFEEHTEDSQKRFQLELEAFITEAIAGETEEDEETGRVKLFEGFAAEKVDTSPSAITLAYEALEGKDRYEILGVGRGASPMEIKKAYFRLAKAYHPDRHHEPGMEAVHPMLVVLFDRLTEAYDILSREPSRSDYDEAQPSQWRTRAQARAGEASLRSRQTAEELGRRGEAALLAGNVKEAIASLEAAVQQDDSKARYHALLGQALATVPNHREDAEAELKRAIELEPANADYHIVLGVVYLQAKALGKALVRFEEALRWDPSSAKAKQLLEQLKNRLFPA